MMPQAELQELLDDAVRCQRLSNWDEGFLADMRGRVGRHGREIKLSERQEQALSRIRDKVYAVG